ncbi:MAG TPA: branched-chain amino acid aminotransferase [Armatimonadota bacterium]|jgi:branched-chain amino acid aminotransferase
MATVNLDWQNLSFQYLPTNGFVQADYADGAWSAPVFKTEPYLPVHIAASCLHYGQSCFEGMKAFRSREGDVMLFRPEQNARRLAFSAERICMQAPPEALFIDACVKAIQGNAEFVPPYGTGASLYLRPLLIGTEPTIGIRASNSYTFIVLVTPVGPYYKNGFFPVEAVVIDGYDRAAPYGTGQAKTGGNYAASLKPGLLAKELGYPVQLFTDPGEHKYVDEFGTSNFIGITAAGEYKTPSSSSILASITNKSLQTLAEDMGLTVVKAPILLESLGQFDEVGACGTAAVITPISAVHIGEQCFRFGKADEAGPTLTKLYRELQGIQYGDIADRHNWLLHIDVSVPARA